MCKCELAVFDLDGTLLDTVCDLASSLNAALKKNSMPVKEVEQYYNMLGKGADKLIELATGLKKEDVKFQKIKSDFAYEYKNNSGSQTYPYSGITTLLKTLQDKQIKLAVLSNKDDCFIGGILKKHFKDINFDMALGKREEFKIKPCPDSLNFIIESLKVRKENILYVGDSEVDIETAKRGGVKSVGAVWGFRGEEELRRAGADFLVYNPTEVLKYIDS